MRVVAKFLAAVGVAAAIVIAAPAGNAHAQGQCQALADVSFTIDGIAKLSSTIIQQQFALLKDHITRISGFKNVLVRPTCPKALNTDTTECISFGGIPALDQNGVPTFQGERPIQLDLQLARSDFDMDLAEPIQCVNFVCDINVRISKFVVEGSVTNMQYADNGQVIAKKLFPQFSLVKPSFYRLKITIDPQAEDLTKLASTQLAQQMVNMPMGAIQIKFRSAHPKETDATKAQNFVNILRQKLADYQKQMQDPAFGTSQADRVEVNFDAAKLSEIEKTRYPPSGIAPACSDQRCVDQQIKEMQTDNQTVKRAYQKYLSDNHTSAVAIAKAAQATAIPSNMTDEQLVNFVQSPPKTLNADDFQQMYLDATNLAESNDDGFVDPNIGQLVVIAENFIQKYMPSIFDQQWMSLVRTDLEPAVTTQVNSDLGAADQYWNQITRIPNLDLQLLERNSRYTSELATAQAQLAQTTDPKEQQALQKQISQLKTQLASVSTQASNDWLPVTTGVVFDHTIPNNPQLLKAHVFVDGGACKNPVSPAFPDATDADLVTDFNIDTVRGYFQKMVQANKLSLCVGSDDPKCKGGTKVAVKNAPSISCDNGQYKMDLGFTVKSFGASTIIEGAVGNCSGSPCFRLQSSTARLNSFVLNLFAGGILDRAIGSALKGADGLGMPIPDMKLVDTQTLPTTCAFRLKWNVVTLPNPAATNTPN